MLHGGAPLLGPVERTRFICRRNTAVQHIDWKIKILIIFPLSALIIIPWFLFQTLILKGYIELIIAIILGSIGSYYIFGNEEKNEI